MRDRTPTRACLSGHRQAWLSNVYPISQTWNGRKSENGYSRPHGAASANVLLQSGSGRLARERLLSAPQWQLYPQRQPLLQGGLTGNI
jgi:hypothetical protein